MPAPTGGPDGLREIEDELDVALAFGGDVREIGQRLHAVVGSTAAMLVVLYRVAARDETRSGLRVATADRAWHGIGIGRDLWLP